MTTQIAPFEFEGNQFRTIPTIDGAFEVVAADVARVLSYRKASDMLRVVPEDEKGAQIVRTPGGDQQMATLTEAGLYSIIMQRQAGYVSDPAMSETIRRFQRWVTHEVLPAIRKTGSYGVAPMTPEELMARALVQAQSTIEAAESRIRELEPAAESWETLASAKGDYAVRDAAQILARAGITIGQGRLFRWLREYRWIDKTNRPYQTHVDRGLIAEMPRSFKFTRTNGEEQLAAPQVRITVKGIDVLRRVLDGQPALIEVEP